MLIKNKFGFTLNLFFYPGRTYDELGVHFSSVMAWKKQFSNLN